MSASVSSNSSDISSTYENETKQPSVILNVNNTASSSALNIETSKTTDSITNNVSVETVIPTQLAQWVYIQTQTSKVNLSNSSSNKTNASNIIVNALPQLQISNLGSNIPNLNNKSSVLSQGIQLPTNIAIPANQGVILTQPINNSIKPQHLVIQKSSGNIQAVPVVPVSVATNTGAKNALVHFTMIKPNESTRIQQYGGLGKIKTSENLQIIVSSVHSTTNTTNSSLGHKYVIAPMPKVTTNRLPMTATTNAVQSKIAFMPISVANSGNNNSNKQKTFNFKITDGHVQGENNGTVKVSLPDSPLSNISKHKTMFNFKIADGQLQSDSSGGIKILCGTNDDEKESEDTEDKTGTENDKLICDETISLSSPEKKESVEEKSYELSIVENSNSSKSDMSFTITIPDDQEKTKTYENKHMQREAPKFAKHGVSILKKNFVHSDRKSEKSQSSLIISPMPNSITTISDMNTKEVKITSSNFEQSDSLVVTECKMVPQKAERRRKSNFAYRKDYDEIMVSTENSWDKKKVSFDRYKQFENSDIMLTKLDDTNVTEKKENKSTVEDMVEIEVIKQETANEITDEYDISNVLNWEDGIGTLPGSELKFQMNEYGFLEYLTKEEYKQLMEQKKTNNNEIKIKKEYQDVIRCTECGCYGLPSDFINTKYCSFDCQETGNKNAKDRDKIKRKKKKPWIKKNSSELLSNKDSNDLKMESEQSPSDEENTSNENSTDKYTYPWNCTKKGFSWSKYLDHIKAKAAPVKLFKDPFPYTRNGFRPGMKLEGIDPQHPSYFCVLTIAEVVGYRMRLHFDGYPENYDFWVNADSMNIFPAGWCEKYGHVLHPPPGYTIEDFNWTNYLKQTKSTAAPKHLFVNRSGNTVCPNGFRIGMKLEAVDRKNTSLICVATIADMMDNRLLIHFDSWDDIYDYWADPTSPYIHPVGWCDQYGHNLTPPNGYPNPELFTWEKYLKETKSTAAPVRAFKQRPACGFKRSMRLEAVDKRVPQLIRVATVDDVREHQIRIKFDGWPDRYSYWVDDDSTDIHPVGWCQKTNHPIEPPLTPDDVYDFLECPTVGCRGIGHIKGPKCSTHTSQKHCPYAEENIDKDNVLPDRLLSPDCQLEAVVPVSREPKEKPKPKLGRPPKIPRLEIKPEWSESEDVKPPKRKYRKRCKSESPELSKTHMISLTNGFTQPPVDPIWAKHTKYLQEFIRNDTDPREWTESEVVEFVNSLPNCKDHGALFNKHNIDGEALLMLTQQDLTDILNIKLGPAIKLYNTILLLRQNVII